MVGIERSKPEAHGHVSTQITPSLHIILKLSSPLIPSLPTPILHIRTPPHLLLLIYDPLK